MRNPAAATTSTTKHLNWQVYLWLGCRNGFELVSLSLDGLPQWL